MWKMWQVGLQKMLQMQEHLVLLQRLSGIRLAKPQNSLQPESKITKIKLKQSGGSSS